MDLWIHDPLNVCRSRVPVASAWRAPVGGKSADEAVESLRCLVEEHPEVNANCVDVRFPGRGERIYTKLRAHKGLYLTRARARHNSSSSPYHSAPSSSSTSSSSLSLPRAVDPKEFHLQVRSGARVAQATLRVCSIHDLERAPYRFCVASYAGSPSIYQACVWLAPAIRVRVRGGRAPNNPGRVD